MLLSVCRKRCLIHGYPWLMMVLAAGLISRYRAIKTTWGTHQHQSRHPQQNQHKQQLPLAEATGTETVWQQQQQSLQAGQVPDQKVVQEVVLAAIWFVEGAATQAAGDCRHR